MTSSAPASPTTLFEPGQRANSEDPSFTPIDLGSTPPAAQPEESQENISRFYPLLVRARKIDLNARDGEPANLTFYAFTQDEQFLRDLALGSLGEDVQLREGPETYAARYIPQSDDLLVNRDDGCSPFAKRFKFGSGWQSVDIFVTGHSEIIDNLMVSRPSMGLIHNKRNRFGEPATYGDTKTNKLEGTPGTLLQPPSTHRGTKRKQLDDPFIDNSKRKKCRDTPHRECRECMNTAADLSAFNSPPPTTPPPTTPLTNSDSDDGPFDHINAVIDFAQGLAQSSPIQCKDRIQRKDRNKYPKRVRKIEGKSGQSLASVLLKHLKTIQDEYGVSASDIVCSFEGLKRTGRLGRGRVTGVSHFNIARVHKNKNR